jgi:outer membrane protein OmpA-like peptidoglycan-associated protein
MDTATPELNEAIRFVGKYLGSRIEILGHTDNIGTPQYNQTLSEKRAQAVRHYLIKAGGVDPARITAKGFRDLYPVALNRTPDGRDNPEGRALNRRVEINIMAD